MLQINKEYLQLQSKSNGLGISLHFRPPTLCSVTDGASKDSDSQNILSANLWQALSQKLIFLYFLVLYNNNNQIAAVWFKKSRVCWK